MDRPCRGNQYIRELDDGSVIVDRGPMLMSISVSSEGMPHSTWARQGAYRALEVLETLAGFRSLITQRINLIASVDALPSVVRKMVLVAREFDDPTVTPLIAVAGAGANEVADFIYNNWQVSKVVVNNGGDIAIRLRNEETVKIGIKTDLTEKSITHILTVTEKSGIGGVATSGFGGRSFTRGVANAAVAVAVDSICADVAATLIGNATNVKSHLVKRAIARNLYHSTDIPDLWVTTSVGDLAEEEVGEALDKGMQKAETFHEKGLIIGAFLAVKDQIRLSKSIVPFTQPASDLVAV